MKNRKLRAYLTVEMTFIATSILLLFMGIVLVIFYCHDKNIISGVAYETAVTGSIKMREKEGITEEELSSFCKGRLKGKLIFLTNQLVDISILKEEVIVEISASKKGYSVSTVKRAAITIPENKIRNIRRFKIKDGTKNYD